MRHADMEMRLMCLFKSFATLAISLCIKKTDFSIRGNTVSEIVPYPGWEIIITDDGTVMHIPCYETIMAMQRKADMADELAGALEELKFAYINKDPDEPHDFETKALSMTDNAINKYREIV